MLSVSLAFPLCPPLLRPVGHFTFFSRVEDGRACFQVGEEPDMLAAVWKLPRTHSQTHDTSETVTPAWTENFQEEEFQGEIGKENHGAQDQRRQVNPKDEACCMKDKRATGCCVGQTDEKGRLREDGGRSRRLLCVLGQCAMMEVEQDEGQPKKEGKSTAPSLRRVQVPQPAKCC